MLIANLCASFVCTFQVLFEQFSVFLNLVFLVIACSQFIPELGVGRLYTYWGPLGFVIAITMIREAVDDIGRWSRDRDVNMAVYGKYVRNKEVSVMSSDIKVSLLEHCIELCIELC